MEQSTPEQDRIRAEIAAYLAPKPEPRILESAKDVTPELLEWAERVHDDWFSDEDTPIDWEDFIDRFADPHGHRDPGAEPFEIDAYDNPAIRKIQRHVRAYRKGLG